MKHFLHHQANRKRCLSHPAPCFLLSKDWLRPPGTLGMCQDCDGAAAGHANLKCALRKICLNELL